MTDIQKLLNDQLALKRKEFADRRDAQLEEKVRLQWELDDLRSYISKVMEPFEGVCGIRLYYADTEWNLWYGNRNLITVSINQEDLTIRLEMLNPKNLDCNRYISFVSKENFVKEVVGLVIEQVVALEGK